MGTISSVPWESSIYWTAKAMWKYICMHVRQNIQLSFLFLGTRSFRFSSAEKQKHNMSSLGFKFMGQFWKLMNPILFHHTIEIYAFPQFTGWMNAMGFFLKSHAIPSGWLFFKAREWMCVWLWCDWLKRHHLIPWQKMIGC